MNAEKALEILKDQKRVMLKEREKYSQSIKDNLDKKFTEHKQFMMQEFGVPADRPMDASDIIELCIKIVKKMQTV